MQGPKLPMRAMIGGVGRTTNAACKKEKKDQNGFSLV